jgi:hypothetical protein
MSCDFNQINIFRGRDSTLEIQPSGTEWERARDRVEVDEQGIDTVFAGEAGGRTAGRAAQ